MKYLICRTDYYICSYMLYIRIYQYQYYSYIFDIYIYIYIYIYISVYYCNGVGSCSVLGGTVHYQDTISMEKNSFGVTPKTGGHQPLAPLVLRLYMYCIYYHIRIVFSELHCIDHGFESMHAPSSFFLLHCQIF